MKGLLADFKHAFRLYRRTPGASVIAVVVLAVGMAFVSAFLSLYVDLALKPHPGFDGGGRIVTIAQNDGERFTGLSMRLIGRMTDEVTSLDAAVGIGSLSFPSGPDQERLRIEYVTPGFFDGLRPKLQLGRGFGPADHAIDAEPAVVISDEFWRARYDGSADVLGTLIEIEGRQFAEDENPTVEARVVGVMSPDFAGVNGRVSFWIPFEQVLRIWYPPETHESRRTTTTLRVLGRRSRSASAEAVVAELNSRYLEAGMDLRIGAGMRLDAIDGIVRDLNVHRDSQRQLRLFLAASVLLALVAAANVSLFLLARAPGRRRELGIRMSVGAPLKRVARQLASEAGFLVAVAAVIGLAMSVWLGSFLRGLAFLRQAEWTDVTLFDWRVLSLVAAFLLVLILLVSLAPVLGLRRLGIAASSRQVAARATLAQRVAGTVQIAIAGMLGGAAVAFGWYLASMMLGYPGFETRNTYMAQYSLSGPLTLLLGGSTDNAVVETTRRREAIEAIPGVTRVTFGTPAPAGLSGRSWSEIPDPSDSTERIRVYRGSIDDRYIDVLGLRLVQGRAPEGSDVAVAVVNQAFAQQFFGRDNVVGESVPVAVPGGQRTEIVGVLADLSFEHPSADIEPLLLLTSDPRYPSIAIIESSLTAADLQRQLERIDTSGEVQARILSVRPLRSARHDIIAPDRARALLTIGTASLVVCLAAFGFYGTQRYLVTAGRREYAIRASLGAGPKALGRLVFRRGLMLSLPGLVIGSMLAFILVAWLRDDFVSRDISPGAVTAAVVAGLTLLLLAASLGPARQARRTQPAPLLREE